MGLAIGVDLGGTKIAAGLVDDAGVIVSQNRRPTPVNSSDAVIACVVELVSELSADIAVDGVCVAVPGFVDAGRSTLKFTPNLPMKNIELKSILQTALNLPVVVENDANAAAWAEARFGAARGASNSVMLTVGTGLGGGIVIDDRLIRGAAGFAAELGHMTMVIDGLHCGCGLKGCWEQYCSGNALLRTARKLAAKNRNEASILLGFGDGSPEGIQGPHITSAAQADCPIAIAAFNEVGLRLGIGMATVSAILDPEIFVVGGGVIEAGELLLAPARKAFEAHITARTHRVLPDIVAATLGNDAGIVGAADLARNI
jgi:glucokinase